MKVKIAGVDIETEMADPKRGSPYSDTMLLVTCSTNTGQEFIWDCRNEDIPSWFLEMLEDEHIVKIFHNASFDTKYLKHNYNVRTRNIWCSLMNERLLWLGDRRVDCGLDGTLQRRFGITLDKSLRKSLAMGIVGVREKEYALKDIRYLIPLYQEQQEDIGYHNMVNASWMENELSFIFGQMEYYGLPFDNGLYSDYMSTAEKLKSDAAKVVWDLMGYSYSKNMLTGHYEGGLNLASQQKALTALQRKGILISDYGEKTLVKYLHTKKGSQYDEKKKIILAILEYKKWDKALSWQYDNLIDPISNTILPSYNSLGAETSRTSSSDPNGQNIATEYYVLKIKDGELVSEPSGIDFRKMFIAPKGWKWIGADYSQIELRLYGGIAGVKSIIDEYNKGDKADLHRQAASMIYGKHPDEIDGYERNLGKPVNFGGRTFGGGPNAIINAALKHGLLLSWDEAEKMQYLITRGDPEGIKWGRKVTEEAKENGYIYTLGEHRRLLPYPEQIRETVCRNTPIQGTASDIGKLGIIKFFDWIEKGHGLDNVRLLSYVHDELNSISKEEIAEETRQAKVDCMLEAGEVYMKSLGVPCKVDSYIADYWKK